jgi:hypothetical protein
LRGKCEYTSADPFAVADLAVAELRHPTHAVHFCKKQLLGAIAANNKNHASQHTNGTAHLPFDFAFFAGA